MHDSSDGHGGLSMKKVKRNFISVLIILIAILVVSGCSSNNSSKAEIDAPGLLFDSLTLALGGEGNPDLTKVNYTFNLKNRLNQPIMIKTIEPILTPELKERLTDSDITMKIDKEMIGDSSETISGTFYINTMGLSKEEILGLDIKVKQFKITSEQVIGN